MLRRALLLLFLFAAADARAQVFVPAGEPDPLVERLRSLIDQQQYQAVADTVGPLIERARAVGDSVQFLRLICSRGQAQLGTGKPLDSLQSLRRATTMAEAYEDTNTVLLAMGVEALALNYLGRFEESLSKVDRRLELARAANDQRSLAFGHLSAGYALLNLGRLAEARGEYDQAIEGFAQTKLRYWQITSLVGRGRIETNLGDIDAARRTFNEVIRVSREIGDRRNELDAINNLGVLEFKWGDMGRAAERFDQAHAMALEHGDTRQALTMMSNSAIMRWFEGEISRAEAMFEEALRIAEDAESPPGYFGVLRMLGQLQIEQGRLARGEEILRRVADESPSTVQRVEAGSALAIALSTAGRNEDALELLDSVDPTTLGVTDVVAEGNYALRKGRILVRLGRSDEALATVLGVVGPIESLTNASLASLIAYCFAIEGKLDDSLEWIRRCLDRREKLRENIASSDWREFLQEQSTRSFVDAVAAATEIASSAEQRAELFHALQRSKARSLADRIQSPRQTEHEEIVGARHIAEVQREILADDELLLDYHFGADRLLLVAVRSNELRFFQLDMPPRELDERVRRFREAIAASRGSPSSRVILESTAARLGEVLIGPALSMFEGSHRILISPDGAIASIPFELLTTSGDNDTLRLRDFELSRVPSISIRPLLTPSELAVAGVATLRGDSEDLSGAEAEMSYLQSRFRDVKETDESRVLHPPVGAAVLHVAAHTDVDAERPWQSGIRLRPATSAHSNGSRDTHLRARELLDTQLDVHLAVLATCGSGLGRIRAGEGVMGLSTAFLVANVPSVVATLWPVDDATTSRLMREFYGEIAGGASVSAALRVAQSALRRDPETAHPYHWAGFFVMGRGEIPIELTTKPAFVRYARPILAAALLLLLALLIGAARRRRSV